MTADEMFAYARDVVAGKAVKRAEVVAFMQTLLTQAEPGPMPEPAPAAAEVPQASVTTYTAPTIPDGVKVTSTGRLHIEPTVARTYTKAEALAFAAGVMAVASRLE